MYPYYPTDNPSKFGFITDKGISYIVEFSDASGYFESSCPPIEGVSFNPIGRKNGKDEKIASTIVEIIKYRCKAQNNAVVYVCNQSGDKSRSKLFKGWNGMFNGGEFHFQPPIIEYPIPDTDTSKGCTGKIYTGIIIDTKNKHAHTYLQEFTSSLQFISGKLN